MQTLWMKVAYSGVLLHRRTKILTLLLLKMRVMKKLMGRTRIEVMTPTARDLHDTSISPNSPVYCTIEKGILIVLVAFDPLGGY